MRVLETQKLTGLKNPNQKVMTPRIEPVTEDDGRYFSRVQVAKLIGVRSRNTVWQYHRILLQYPWYAKYSLRENWRGRVAIDPRTPISREQLQALKLIAKVARSSRRIDRVEAFVKNNASRIKQLVK